ncbi:hypothetical protein GDO86_003878 [Hymenochirus boettgeri]|uniref:Interleukin-18 receptor accessory protein n=1 Tax=Hymenochirus boettgeri TaxID=247094 RepID=A0A8T2K888_9PIPI|nr:hypothetical protein GDO86_003878 [Hymenochirus boettgeri]
MDWIVWMLVIYILKQPVKTEENHAGLPIAIHEEQRYQVFAKDKISIPCVQEPTQTSPVIENQIQWFFEKSNGNLNEIHINNNVNITKKANVISFSSVEISNSGIYICKFNNIYTRIILKVITKDSCLGYGQSNQFVLLSAKNTISCPSRLCYPGQNKWKIKWYKNEIEVLERQERITLKLIDETIVLYTTYPTDAGLYTCDYSLFLNESQWTVRASVDFEVGAQDTQEKPQIFHPENGEHVEAEIGKPLELRCSVFFGFERTFNPIIKWIKLHPDFTKDELRQTHLEAPKKNIRGTVHILTSMLDKVTLNDLNSTFICYAQNSVGNTTKVIKLVKKKADIVCLVYILCGSVVLLLMMLVGSGLIYLRWIELVLLYRNYMSKDETLGDDKDFDAFVSYAKQNCDSDEEFIEDTYNEEIFATRVLPSVLESTYNYKLCILERDILPGGAYVEDIVKIIKRSRRAIVVLSQRYINSPSIFEFQAAITCTLEEEPIKLILIEFSPFKEPESLPQVVKKALSALPTVVWNKSNSSKNTKFWKKVRYHMPVKKNLSLEKTDILMK